jgi:hypothetical protein
MELGDDAARSGRQSTVPPRSLQRAEELAWTRTVSRAAAPMGGSRFVMSRGRRTDVRLSRLPDEEHADIDVSTSVRMRLRFKIVP